MRVCVDETCTRRARPRTGESEDEVFEAVAEGEGGASRIQTAALLEDPLPRRMASRPVDWMAERRREGGVVPVMVMVWVGREGVMIWIPIV